MATQVDCGLPVGCGKVAITRSVMGLTDNRGITQIFDVVRPAHHAERDGYFGCG
jgi:hypothetical protein